MVVVVAFGGVVDVFVEAEGMGVTLVVGRVVFEEVGVADAIFVTLVTEIMVFVGVFAVCDVFWVIRLELMGIGEGGTGCASGAAVVVLGVGVDDFGVVLVDDGGEGATTGFAAIGCIPFVGGTEVLLDVFLVGAVVDLVAGRALLTVNLILLVILTGVFDGD